MSRSETSHRWPFFLPDGTHYLFTIRSSDADVRGIYLGQLDSPRRARLIDDLSNAQYAQTPDGRGFLLFVRGSSLMAQTLDVSHSRVTGEPFALADKLWLSEGWSFSAFSSGAGLLAYQTAPSVRDSQLAWIDRVGKTLEVVARGSGTAKLSLSRDERKLLFTSLDPTTGTSKLWLADLEHSALARLTAGGHEDERWGIWSPRGDRLAFVTSSGAWVADANGEHKRLVVPEASAIVAIKTGTALALELNDWSPDGAFVVMTRRKGTSGSSIWAVPVLDSGSPVLLTPGLSHAEYGAVSPDGKWLAYDAEGPTQLSASIESTESATSQVFVQPFHGTAADTRTQMTTAGGVMPHWSPAGGELFYFDDARLKIMSVPIASARELQADQPRTVLDLPYTTIRSDFVVADHGNRFLVAMPYAGTLAPATVVLNWPALLPKRAR
jgi:hypothetical protein